MITDPAQNAIKSALNCDWDASIRLNKEILEKDPQNIDALNRLARAFCEMGEISKAKNLSKKVLKIDAFNTIAQKTLERWKNVSKTQKSDYSPVKPEIFLEEPGKTKIVGLINIGDKGLIAKLNAGDEVKLNTHGHKICITSRNGKYLGKLPDDLSARLKSLVKNGYEYRAYLKSIKIDEVKIFIREIIRGQKYRDVPSFSPDKIDYISFTPPELVHKKEEADSDETSDSDSDSISERYDERSE